MTSTPDRNRLEAELARLHAFHDTYKALVTADDPCVHQLRQKFLGCLSVIYRYENALTKAIAKMPSAKPPK